MEKATSTPSHTSKGYSTPSHSVTSLVMGELVGSSGDVATMDMV